MKVAWIAGAVWLAAACLGLLGLWRGRVPPAKGLATMARRMGLSSSRRVLVGSGRPGFSPKTSFPEQSLAELEGKSGEVVESRSDEEELGRNGRNRKGGAERDLQQESTLERASNRLGKTTLAESATIPSVIKASEKQNQLGIPEMFATSVRPMWATHSDPDACPCSGKACHEYCDVRREILDLFTKAQQVETCPESQYHAIIYDLHYVSGLGHHLHQLGHGMTYSMMYQRPLIIFDPNWGYAGPMCKKLPKFTCFFQPLGRCTYKSLEDKLLRKFPTPGSGGTRVMYNRFRSAKNDSSPMWISSELSERWVPHGLANRIRSFHNRPYIAVKSILIQHIFRVSEEVKTFLEMDVYPRIDLQRPMVGLHIRRTDKLHAEASLHHVWEYFEHVDRFFERNPPKSGKPSVFIATDEPRAVKEAKSTWGSRYNIVNLDDASIVANSRHGILTKVQDRGTMLTIADILLLANCDFLVGTFSSQISRLAFELMIARAPYSTYEKQQKRKPDLSRPIWVNRVGTPFQVPQNELHRDNLPVIAVSLDDYHYYNHLGGKTK